MRLSRQIRKEDALRGCLKSPYSVKFGDYTRSFQLPNTWAESYARTLSVEISGLFKHPLKLLLLVPIAVVAVELTIAAVVLIAAVSHGALTTGPVRRVVVRESSAR